VSDTYLDVAVTQTISTRADRAVGSGSTALFAANYLSAFEQEYRAVAVFVQQTSAVEAGPEHAPRGWLRIDVDGDLVIVSDLTGAAVGTAASVPDALADWSDLARRMRKELEGSEHQLHPRMAARRDFLQSLPL
jgi:hypothetical protein